VPKHVASRILGTDDLTWHNSHLIEGDPTASVARLAQGEGGDIAVNGSISVVRRLFDAGVLDRLTLTIRPVVAGAGRRLFEPGQDTTRLALIDQITTPAGNVVVTYRRRD
jgi:dihydrofolate reductase